MTTIYSFLVEYSVHVLRSILLCIAGYYATAWIRTRVYKYLSRIYPDELRSLIIARIISYAFLFIIATALLHEFGLNITALLGTVGIIGLAVAYASQTSVANIISGLFLAIEHPFSIGDILIVDAMEGTVEGVNLFAVMLRTTVGTIIRIPHEQLLKHTFVNISALPMRAYTITLDIAVDEDVERVQNIIQDVINTNKWCDKKRSLILLKKISGDSLTLTVCVWAQQRDILAVQKSFLIELKKAFDTQSVTMAIQGVCNGKR